MSSLRYPYVWLLVFFVAVGIGCASAELDDGDVDDGDAGHVDTTLPDTEPPDTSVDPCEDCADHEICFNDACVDPCVEAGAECGMAQFDGDQFDCGGCPAGACDEETNQCPDICGAFYAECGDIFWESSVYDCGNCAGSRRCRSNRCTDDAGYVAVAAGRAHTCAVTQQGSVQCWGRNDYGQLGNANLSQNSSSPVTVAHIGNASSLAGLNHHACVIRSGGDVSCWGHNSQGQLGDGTTEHSDVPVSADGVAAFSVATGGSHTCAIVDAERLRCWGDNDFGQLGNGTTSSEPHHDKDFVLRPGDELASVVDLALGTAHTCAVRRDNDAFCWGANHSGQLGLGHTQDGPATAERIGDLGPVHTISAGFNHSCAIAVGGDVYCWGRGDDGQLGDGEATNSSRPVEVQLSAPAIAISTGRFHSCAVTDGGDVFCWGANSRGQMGQGTTVGHFETPVPVPDLGDVVSVAVGGAHSCALHRDGSLKCWGDNEYGQIGDGTDSNERPSATGVTP